MQKVTKEYIQSLPVATDLDIQVGDLIFLSGEYQISKMIQHVSDSIWSHVALIFSLFNQVMVLESIESLGVRIIPLNKYLADYNNTDKKYEGEIIIARCSNNLGSDNRQSIFEFGLNQIGRPYDTTEIAKILSRIMLNKPHDKDLSDKQYICSELVYECFKKAGIEFDYDKRGFMAPENIWKDDRIKLIQRIL